jgi:acetyl-CoA C-acetyltransferase
VGQTEYVTRHRDLSAPELAWQAARRALDDAELSIDAVDAVVFATAPESFEGVNCPDKWAADAVGGLGRPFMRINTGGATGASGAHAAVHHVASGVFEVVLVVALQRVGQTPDAQRILNLIWDPIFAKGFPLNLPATTAMMASTAMARSGMTEEHMARISAKDHRNALANPHAHVRVDVGVEDVLASRVICSPLKLLDCCPRSDGGCALVLASEGRAPKICSRPAWVTGIGAVTLVFTPGEVGERDEGSEAVRRAYRMAGIEDPRTSIDVVEPYDPFSFMEIGYYHTFGFARDEAEAVRMVEDGFGEMDGEIPFSPSGGVLCSNPIGATALVRIAEAALQVMGRAGARQVPEARTALATGVGGSPGPGSATFLNATVLARNPR